MRCHHAILLPVLSAFGLAAVLILPRLPCFLLGSDPAQPADVIVVLAGGRWTRPRLNRGLELMHQKMAGRLVVSGVEFDPQHPAFDAVAWQTLADNGVPGTVVDAQSDVTRKTAQFVTTRAEKQGWRRVLVVTSDYHWRRARAIFHKECPETVITVTTIPSGDYAGWLGDPYLRRVVRNECVFLAGFFLFQSPHGARLLAIIGIVCLALLAARRLWRKRLI